MLVTPRRHLGRVGNATVGAAPDGAEDDRFSVSGASIPRMTWSPPTISA
jgi:hypothetical protein